MKGPLRFVHVARPEFFTDKRPGDGPNIPAFGDRHVKAHLPWSDLHPATISLRVNSVRKVFEFVESHRSIELSALKSTKALTPSSELLQTPTPHFSALHVPVAGRLLGSYEMAQPR